MTRIRVIYRLLDRLQRRDTVGWFDAGLAREVGGRSALEAFARERRRELLAHALQSVPFYADRLGRLSSSPDTLAQELFERIPPLEKGDIAARGTDLIARGRCVVEPGASAVTSGGTTGPPTRIWLDRAAQDAHAAAGLRSFLWWGADPTRRHALLWGPPPDEDTYDTRLGRIKGRLLGRELLPSYGMDAALARRYWDRIRSLRIGFIAGYSSALVRVAATASEGEVARVEHAVVPAAEPFFDFQRPLLERRFGAPVRERYGCNEFSLLAHECAAGRMHVATDRVHLELVGPDGRPVGKGEIGEVLVTDLDNRLMPLIRYRIGDLAEWGDECTCPLPFPVLARVHGRRRDLLLDPQGRWISPHAWAAALQGTPARGLQLLTDARGVVREIHLESERFAVDECVDRWRLLGGVADLRVRFVEDLRRSRSGKHLPVLGPSDQESLG